MDVSFVETMRGSVVDGDGQERAIEFEVKAWAPTLGGFLRSGRTELSGLVRAPSVGPEAPARGELVLSPGLLSYDVRFQGPDGTRYLLEGQKHPRPWSPLRSMTEMEVVLRTEAGRVVGQGSMRFDLRELGAFLATWLPVGRSAQRALDARRRAVERRALDGEDAAAATGGL